MPQPISVRRHPAKRAIVRWLGAVGACCAMGSGFAQTVDPQPANRVEADPDVTLLDRVVVTATPVSGAPVDPDNLPYTVQTATAGEIADAHATNLTDFAARRLNGVNSNEVQGSPFQTDITYRGFRASALPGAPQGVSVYLDGVRINEPFADVVSWDMVPEAAIDTLVLMPGANPLYGQNTLGGALVLTTKSGATGSGVQADVAYGSDARKRVDASYGHVGANATELFLAATLFDEDGWRDASEGRTGSVFAKFGQSHDAGDWSLSLLHGQSRLIGNGLLPSWRFTDEGREPGLYEMDRRSVFTSPDLTRNRNTMATLRFVHELGVASQWHLLAYHRQGRRSTINGDLSPDYEEYVEECGDGFDASGAPLDDDCDDDADEAALIPSGVFNTTHMQQRVSGVAASISQRIGTHQLAWGATYDWNSVHYEQFEQPGTVDAARAIQPIAGSDRAFFSGVRGKSHALGVFVSDLWELRPGTFLSASLRWNRIGVDNTLSTAEDEQLPRERFSYSKANPAIGLTHKFGAGFAWFANASQNSRAPTAIELGCADPERPCRLPTGLQADPYLDQIVSRTYETGLRWNPTPRRSFSGSLYRADNRNDILFLRAPNSQQGYFDNVDRTRYQGVDLQYMEHADRFDLHVGYSLLDATYQTHGELLAGERIIALAPGMRIAGLPRHTIKWSVDWRVTPRLTLGTDMQAMSRRIASGNEDGLVANLVDEDGEEVDDPQRLRHDLSTPGYALFNLQAVWSQSEHLSFYLRVNNVFDRRFETYAAIAEDLFPDGELAQPLNGPVEGGPSRFVAPGAPRQFTAGMRLRF